MSRIFAQYFSAALFDKDDEFARTISEVDKTLVSEWWLDDELAVTADEPSDENNILNEIQPGSSREIS